MHTHIVTSACAKGRAFLSRKYCGDTYSPDKSPLTRRKNRETDTKCVDETRCICTLYIRVRSARWRTVAIYEYVFVLGVYIVIIMSEYTVSTSRPPSNTTQFKYYSLYNTPFPMAYTRIWPSDRNILGCVDRCTIQSNTPKLYRITRLCEEDPSRHTQFLFLNSLIMSASE